MPCFCFQNNSIHKYPEEWKGEDYLSPLISEHKDVSMDPASPDITFFMINDNYHAIKSIELKV